MKKKTKEKRKLEYLNSDQKFIDDFELYWNSLKLKYIDFDPFEFKDLLSLEKKLVDSGAVYKSIENEITEKFGKYSTELYFPYQDVCWSNDEDYQYLIFKFEKINILVVLSVEWVNGRPSFYSVIPEEVKIKIWNRK